MSITCEYCGEVMGRGEGCTYSHIVFTPKSDFIKRDPDLLRSHTLILPRTRVGALNDMFTMKDYEEMGRDRCQDCGAKVGTFHHQDCDNERCPHCGGQLISCDCYEDYHMEICSFIDPIDKEPQTDFDTVLPPDKVNEIIQNIPKIKWTISEEENV